MIDGVHLPVLQVVVPLVCAPLIVLEAMKMEHTMVAPAAGKVKAFHYAVGEPVADGAELLEFEKAS